VSLPAFPIMVSLPAPPVSVSLPLPPDRVSFPSRPKSWDETVAEGSIVTRSSRSLAFTLMLETPLHVAPFGPVAMQPVDTSMPAVSVTTKSVPLKAMSIAFASPVRAL
jgi:hypothetical protein